MFFEIELRNFLVSANFLTKHTFNSAVHIHLCWLHCHSSSLFIFDVSTSKRQRSTHTTLANKSHLATPTNQLTRNHLSFSLSLLEQYKTFPFGHIL